MRLPKAACSWPILLVRDNLTTAMLTLIRQADVEIEGGVGLGAIASF